MPGTETQIVIANLSPEQKRSLYDQYASANGWTFYPSTNSYYDNAGNKQLINDTDVEKWANQTFIAESPTQTPVTRGWNIEKLPETLHVGLSAFDNSNQTALSTAGNGLYQGIGKLLEQGGPGAQKAATAMKWGSVASDMMGAAGLGSQGNTTIGELSNTTFGRLGLGWQNVYKRSADKFGIDMDVAANQGSSYTGSMNTLKEAAQLSGGQYGILEGGGLRRANRKIAEANRQQGIMSQINQNAMDQQGAVSSLSDIAANAFALNSSGGFDPRFIRITKQGGNTSEFIPVISNPRFNLKIYGKGGLLYDPEEFVPVIAEINSFVPEIAPKNEFIPKVTDVGYYQKGGNIIDQLDAPEIEESGQQNLIPEGALHKNKHRMDNADNLTKKGIPVVGMDGEQQAEIERNEIIFNKGVSTCLEEMCEIYFTEGISNEEKDKIAFEAGKLITKEIMFNTDDRTGLIDSLQKGGKLGDDKYKEWLSDFTEDEIDDLTKDYDLETIFNFWPIERMDLWKNIIMKMMRDELPLEIREYLYSKPEEWHLPSVLMLDDDNGIFLKKGKTTKQNKELKYEFDWYNGNPKFKSEYEMIFDDGHNRWTYRRRDHN